MMTLVLKAIFGLTDGYKVFIRKQITEYYITVDAIRTKNLLK